MVNLTIDGKRVSVKEGTRILQAAKESGINIPTLCYHKNLTPFGACRICLVEIEGMRGRLVPSCTTPVGNEMVVRTITPNIIQARRTVVELILIHHPLDCLVCDKGGECELQNLCYDLDLTGNRFRGERHHFEVDHRSPLIERNLNRCILCGKCVRICDEVQDVAEIIFINRGFDVRVGTAYDKPLNCDFCGLCLSTCSVGALTSKQFKYKARVWELTTKDTICPYCSTGCTFSLNIKDNKVLRITTDPDVGINDGMLCNRGRFGYGFINSEHRIKKPLIKKSGRFVEVDWEDALSFVAEEFERIKTRNGSDSIGGLGSARLTNEENYLFQKFMRACVGTNSIDHAGGFSWTSQRGLMEVFGLVGSMTNSIAEIMETDLILSIRCNVAETQPVIGLAVKKAVKQNGAKLILAEPRDIRISKRAHRWLRCKPGSEVLLLLGFINVILTEGLQDDDFVKGKTQGLDDLKKGVVKFTPFNVEAATGVPKEEIVNAARDYAQAERAIILISSGMGLQADKRELALAAANLVMLTGNIGMERAGVAVLGEKCNSQGALDMGVVPHLFPGYQDVTDIYVRDGFERKWNVKLPYKAGLNALDMMREAIKGNLKALYIIGENPVVTYPGTGEIIRALRELELLVVQDIFLTPTAKLADVILPAVSFAEKTGTFTNAERRIQRFRQAITPQGEGRADWKIICGLSKKMGFDMDYNSPSDIMDEISQVAPIYGGIAYGRVDGLGLQWPCPNPNHPGTRYICPTNLEEGKGRFIDFEPKLRVETVDDEYPYTLNIGSLLFHSGSLSLQADGPMEIAPEAFVEIHPDDARALDVTYGDWVHVGSRHGEIKIKARIDSRSLEGTVFIPYHFDKTLVNKLTSFDQMLPAVRIEKA